MDKKKLFNDPFFKYIIACCIIILCEVPLYYLGKSLEIPTVYHALTMLVFWLLSASILIRLSHKRLGFDPFSISTQPSNQQLAYAVAICVSFMLLTNLLYHNSKFILALNAYGVQAMTIIALYEISEALIEMLLFLYAQHLFEKYTNNPGQPFGSIVLMFVMGLIYTLIQGPFMGIYMMIMGFCVGLCFKFLRNNPKLTLLLFIIMYLF